MTWKEIVIVVTILGFFIVFFRGEWLNYRKEIVKPRPVLGKVFTSIGVISVLGIPLILFGILLQYTLLQIAGIILLTVGRAVLLLYWLFVGEVKGWIEILRAAFVGMIAVIVLLIIWANLRY